MRRTVRIVGNAGFLLAGALCLAGGVLAALGARQASDTTVLVAFVVATISVIVGFATLPPTPASSPAPSHRIRKAVR